MEHFSVIFSLCSLTILAGSTPTGSSTTIETLWNNAHDVRESKNHHINLKQNTQNDTKYSLIDENPVKGDTQVGEHVADPLYLNNASNAFTTSTGDFSSRHKDMQHSRYNENGEDDAYHTEESVDLSSHDILLDPSLIPARLNRQAEKGDADYASIESISSDVKFSNHDESRSVVPSKQSLDYEDDLGVAEDRFPLYPYWNPYYRGNFPNQRYRANDRREPYSNYWKYPVFPGK